MPARRPTATWAPAMARATYQHSVLPQASPARRAASSSGCTCTLNFWRGNRNLMSSGKRVACGAASSRKFRTILLGQIAQRFPGQRAVGHLAGFSSQPDLSNRLAFHGAAGSTDASHASPTPARKTGEPTQQRIQCRHDGQRLAYRVAQTGRLRWESRGNQTPGGSGSRGSGITGKRRKSEPAPARDRFLRPKSRRRTECVRPFRTPRRERRPRELRATAARPARWRRCRRAPRFR